MSRASFFGEVVGLALALAWVWLAWYFGHPFRTEVGACVIIVFSAVGAILGAIWEK